MWGDVGRSLLQGCRVTGLPEALGCSFSQWRDDSERGVGNRAHKSPLLSRNWCFAPRWESHWGGMMCTGTDRPSLNQKLPAAPRFDPTAAPLQRLRHRAMRLRHFDGERLPAPSIRPSRCIIHRCPHRGDCAARSDAAFEVPSCPPASSAGSPAALLSCQRNYLVNKKQHGHCIETQPSWLPKLCSKIIIIKQSDDAPVVHHPSAGIQLGKEPPRWVHRC